MKIGVETGDLVKAPADLLVVNSFEDAAASVRMAGAAGVVDRALDGLILQLIKEEHFAGKEGEILAMRTCGKIPAKKVAVVGLGKQEDFCLETVREATGNAVQYSQKNGVKTIASVLRDAAQGGLGDYEAGQAMAEAAVLATYRFNKYKSLKEEEHRNTEIEQFTIVEKDQTKARQARKGITDGEIFADATSFARDLVNEPAGEMTPKKLAETARELAAATPEYTIAVETFDKTALAALGAAGILAIARGSDEEPFLIHLIYKPVNPLTRQPANKKIKRIVLVGKGVTFDSGGLSLKPGEHIYEMKLDMAGAAAILGVFSVVGRLKPAVEIHGVIAAVENLPSGKAVKPGDIVKTLSGKTVEIVNTDAEGRVILADALEYAKRLEPSAIIDLATLTGACMVALGDRIAGAMGNDEKLIEAIKQSGEQAGERIWPLPMIDEYKDELKSDVADLSNTHQTRYGGAILGGMFLAKFVDENTPWVHLDIAGPVFAKKPFASYIPKGGTGFGVRTLLEYIRKVK